MRICLVSAAYRPYLSGVGEHVHNLALALQARGHSVHILTTNYGPAAGASGPSAASREPLAVARLGRALIVPALGGHFTLPVGLTLSHQVRSFLRRHDFDVVHCHGIFPPEIAYWAAVHARSPLVTTFHTLAFQSTRLIRAGFRFLFPALQRRFKARIAVSRACAVWAKEWFPGECEVIPNGVDTGRFNPSVPPVPRLAACPSILYVSRIDRRKGLEVLLRAMPEVLRHVPDARLFVVGSGPLERRCRKLCRTLGVERSVEFCGFVQPRDLPAWYSGCTVSCAPALGPESMGIILVEAMACGKPVVAARIPGYDEVITHDRNGLLFPAGNHEALAHALVSTLSSAEERQRLGSQACEDAQRYSWPVIAGRVQRVYEHALAESRHQA